MDITELLLEMDWYAKNDHTEINVGQWIDAIEAAMQEPVASVRGDRVYSEGPNWHHGQLFFTFPPDAAGEIERLKAEIEAAKWVVRQYFEIAEEVVGPEAMRTKIRERESALNTEEPHE